MNISGRECNYNSEKKIELSESVLHFVPIGFQTFPLFESLQPYTQPDATFASRLSGAQDT